MDRGLYVPGEPLALPQPLAEPDPDAPASSSASAAAGLKAQASVPQPHPLPSGSQKTALAASCPLPAQPGALRLLVWMERSSPSHGESLGVPARRIHLCRPGPALSPSVCARHACLPLPCGDRPANRSTKCLAYEGAHYLSQLPCAFFCTYDSGQSPLSPSSRALTPPYHSISVTGMQPRVG